MSVSPGPRFNALRFLPGVPRLLALPLLLMLSFEWACSSASSPTRGSGGHPSAAGGAFSSGGQVAGAGGAFSSGGASAGGRGGMLGAAGGGAPSTAGGAPSTAGGASSTGGRAPATGGGGSSGSGMGGEGWAGEWPPSATFQNPILWQDIADPEVIRVGDVFYYTGSNMHHSPGAPILRSYDLVNWEFAGHAIPSLDFGAGYRLQGTQRAYIAGNWASSLRFRESDQKFYFLACIRTGQTYVWKATQVEGPWVRGPSVGNCYYDAGMLIDDDDKIYVAYGHGNISVAELNADATGQVRAAQVFTTPSSIGTLEGSRMYRVGKYYYIWATRPANGQYVLRSTAPFGPYESREFLLNLAGPTQGAGVPHQGGLVETQAGDWYYMAFVDAYPGARMPVLAPITWENDWPVLVKVNDRWGEKYPFPKVPRPPRLMAPHTGIDKFTSATLGHAWEWNHEPDNTKWSSGAGLTLQTASVTDDLYQARNTLTRRIIGPGSTATLELDYSGMQDGDVAGLGVFRHTAGFVGVKKAAGSTRLVMVNGASLNVSAWTTNSKGTEAASKDISGGKVWLRVSADIRPGTGRQATFHYSTDGVTFLPFGAAHTMSNDWQFFIGYRFAILNYATTSLGGSVKLNSFEIKMN
jgi:beta-xylosidase